MEDLVMTNNEIINQYMKGRRLRRVSGKINNLMAVLPYLIMDLEHSLFCKHIKTIDCKFQAKQMISRWDKVYTKFNKEIFSVLSDDARDYLIDKMDDYEEYIHNNIEMLRIALISAFETIGVEENKHQTLSYIIVCNTIIQAANVVWKRTYLDKLGQGKPHPLLEFLDKHTMRFADVYHCDKQHINLNKFEDVTSAMQALCRRLISWVGFN